MSEILEIIMLICFGASWPINAVKAYKARSTKGTSLLFLCLIFIGYIAGISSKLTNASYMAEISSKWYVLMFYILNLISLIINLIIYFRNKALQNHEQN
ncbi:MAG: hypothetical protein IJJ19_06280 [Erysipelotrichaceae bacterium]|jgi:hypothetical protein|nr:hypothetical protein [Erysipelotrichaceae bacterium]MBR0474592.1 hypothetical protein [Erysipelotrichaceae bacterium]